MAEVALPPELAEFDAEWRLGDRARAEVLARAYVGARNAALAPHLQPCSREELVRMVDLYRAAGREADRLIVDMWLLAYYPRQDVWGDLTVGGLLDAVTEALGHGDALA